MTQPISAFLKPKQMRNTSDIFNAEQVGAAAHRPHEAMQMRAMAFGVTASAGYILPFWVV